MIVPFFPLRPINGGPLNLAPPKRGVWAAEPKFNGWRALVHLPTGRMFNRHGEPLSITKEFDAALAILRPALSAESFEWADCEALERRHNIGKGTLIVLDVVPNPGVKAGSGEGCQTKTPAGTWLAPGYAERRSWLTPVLTVLPKLTEIADKTVYLTPSTLGTPCSPELMWQACIAANQTLGVPFYEGVVMKRADSLYPMQRRNAEETTTAWVKHRWRH